MDGNLLNKWIDFVKDHIYIITTLVFVSLVGLIVIQVYLISVEIDVEDGQFNTEIRNVLKEMRHQIENDEALSENLYKYFTNNLDPGVNKDSLQKALLFQVKDFSDSMLLAKNLDVLKYDLAFYQRIEDTILISSATNAIQPEYQPYSERAGWRIKEAAGGDIFKFGLLFHNKAWYLIYQVSSILIISTLFIIILLGSFFSTNLVVKRQKKMSQLKNDFINNLTHELKTPIFASSVLYKIIRKKITTSSYEDLDYHISLLEKENQQLKYKVEKVLELTLLERDRPNLDWQLIDFHQIIRQKIGIYQILINERNGIILYNMEAEKSMILGDPMHLGNIIDNLMDNALKYSEKGPEIGIETYNQDDNFIVKITDNGIGIEGEHLSFIFDKFFRVSHGNLHQIKGFGLGLSYVKTMTEMHGGKIKVESKKGKGSSFTLVFPFNFKNKKENYASENTFG